jgi:regulator of cell morphogenesis and NO signaling
MKNNNRLNTTLGELVSEFPPIVPVMNKYKLDYCCGGKDSLGAAIKELKLNKDSVLLDLEKAIEENRINETTVKDWQKESISSIIDFILNTQ